MCVCVFLLKREKKGWKPFVGFFKDRLVVSQDSNKLMELKGLLVQALAEAFWVILFEGGWDV